jgi:uncharacterized protein YlxP (DUF503 family)
VVDEPRAREHEREVEEQLDRVGRDVLLAGGTSTARIRRRYRAAMHVAALEVEIRIPASQSLKDRRQVVRSVLDGARQRFAVSAAEVGGQDTWQRATLGFAVVASEARIAEETVDAVDRFLWSRPDLEVVGAEVRWLD